jgi:hypothetical protein
MVVVGFRSGTGDFFIAWSVCAGGGGFVAWFFFIAGGSRAAGWGCGARVVPGARAVCVARLAFVAGLRAAERLELSGRVRRPHSQRLA